MSDNRSNTDSAPKSLTTQTFEAAARYGAILQTITAATPNVQHGVRLLIDRDVDVVRQTARDLAVDVRFEASFSAEAIYSGLRVVSGVARLLRDPGVAAKVIAQGVDRAHVEFLVTAFDHLARVVGNERARPSAQTVRA